MTKTTLFIHGIADSLVPVSMAQALYNAAPPPKQLLLIPNAGHNHIEAEFDKPENLKVIREFTKRVMEDRYLLIHQRKHAKQLD
ncbi:hypothetical protein [Phormidesmis priestleyi]